jgi:hypothetical protein
MTAKARVWKDREDGLWRFAVRNSAGHVFWSGHCRTHEEALSAVLAEIDKPWWMRTA